MAPRPAGATPWSLAAGGKKRTCMTRPDAPLPPRGGRGRHAETRTGIVRPSGERTGIMSGERTGIMGLSWACLLRLSCARDAGRPEKGQASFGPPSTRRIRWVNAGGAQRKGQASGAERAQRKGQASGAERTGIRGPSGARGKDRHQGPGKGGPGKGQASGARGLSFAPVMCLIRPVSCVRSPRGLFLGRPSVPASCA